MNRLVAFYWGIRPDDRGRPLAETLKQDDPRMELSHDCIQWLLPPPEPSRVNPGAPWVHAPTAKAFRHDDSLRITRLLKCLKWLRLQDEARHFQRAPAGLCVKEPGAGVHSMSQAFWPQSLRGVPEWSRDLGAPG